MPRATVGCTLVISNALNCRISRGRHVGPRWRPSVRNGIVSRNAIGPGEALGPMLDTWQYAQHSLLPEVPEH